MSSAQQPESPEIELVETADGEVTLSINNRQAMQGWEQTLMWESGDILCSYGSTFLEVGLGLGLSALRIATKRATGRHVVIENYQRVIDLFRRRHPVTPMALEIVCADFFQHVRTLDPERLDGIFFDPYLPPAMGNDEALWEEVVPLIVRSLRPAGVFIPLFTTTPRLRWQFVSHFDRVIVERRQFRAYSTTEYTPLEGDAFIQCFVKTDGRRTGP